MATLTLLQLRTQVRERTGLESATYPTDAEINTMLNASGSEWWDILVSKFNDYGLTKSSFNLVANQSDYLFASLSTPITDFYKLRGIDQLVSGSTGWQPMNKFELEESREYNRYPGYLSSSGTYPSLTYRVQGDGFELIPAPGTNGTGRVWYIKQFPTMANDASTLAGYNGWEEYLVADTCIKVRAKLDLPTDVFERQKAGLMDRINAAAENLDAGKAMTIKQVRDDWGAW